jgi:4'-phosphopantetheinyl transferase
VGYALSTTHRNGEPVPGILPIDRVDVWTVSLSAVPEQYDRLAHSLSTDERARADRFKFERDRRRFVVGRSALRSILASYLGGQPDSIRFEYGPHGKPLLADAPAGGLEFNASGSDELAVCAVTVGKSVGVDIEFCRPITDNSFLDQCLTTAERAVLAALEPAEKLAAFYRLWTLKEALLKATGEGLSRPMTSVEFEVRPGRPVRLVGDQGQLPDGDGWAFVELAVGPHHVGSLVTAGTHCAVDYRAWSP